VNASKGEKRVSLSNSGGQKGRKKSYIQVGMCFLSPLAEYISRLSWA